MVKFISALCFSHASPVDTSVLFSCIYSGEKIINLDENSASTAISMPILSSGPKGRQFILLYFRSLVGPDEV